MKAEIIAIGDEILIGQIADTNSQWLAKKFNDIGVSIHQIKIVQDDAKLIEKAIGEAIDNPVQIIVLTGGLGPTKDDVTKEGVCNYFSGKMRLDLQVLEANKALFERCNYDFTEVIKKQAEVPSNSISLINDLGTAPGMWISNCHQVIISLPGVPSEMKGLMIDKVIPRLQDSYMFPHIIHKTLLLYGLGESKVEERIAIWEENLPNTIKVAYLPDFGKLRLRLSAKSNNKIKVESQMEEALEGLLPLLKDIFVGFEEDGNIESLVAKLLIQKKKTLATAESCTGGQIAQMITAQAGASKYYKGSIIAYASEVKIQELGVSPALIEKHTVVSCSVAEAMAKGVQEKFKTDYAIATTGNAGPTTDRTDKSVGIVCLAIATPSRVYSEEFNFGQPREKVILKASLKAFEMLKKKFKKEENKFVVI